jgi:hypothetical protein
LPIVPGGWAPNTGPTDARQEVMLRNHSAKAGRPLASAKALPPNAWFGGRLTFWAPEHPTAAVGPLRPITMSAPTAVMAPLKRHSVNPLLNYLVGGGEQFIRNGEAERPSGFEVDRKLEFGWQLHRQILRFLALQNAVDIRGGATL